MKHLRVLLIRLILPDFTEFWVWNPGHIDNFACKRKEVSESRVFKHTPCNQQSHAPLSYSNRIDTSLTLAFRLYHRSKQPHLYDVKQVQSNLPVSFEVLLLTFWFEMLNVVQYPPGYPLLSC